MPYIKPQVIIHQEFSQPTTADETTLRAMIVGPNANLHRYSDATEKAEILLPDEYNPEGIKATEANPNGEMTYLYPERTAGGVVDKDYSKLYVDDALLSYYEDMTQATKNSGDTIDVQSAVDQANLVKTNINLISNGSAHPRYSGFGSRDVQIGDYAWLQAYVGNGTENDGCKYYEHLSKIIGFAPEEEPATIGTVSPKNITAGTTASGSIAIEGTTVSSNDIANKAYLGVTGTYDNLASPEQSPSYTITVKSIRTTNNCAKSVIVDVVGTTKSADTVYGLEIFTKTLTRTVTTPGQQEGNEPTTTTETYEAFVFDIGAYGWVGVIENPNKLAENDTWTVSQTFGYKIPKLTVDGTYLGEVNDTYIVEFIQGGSFGANNKAIGEAPKLMLRTALGLDYVAEASIYEKNKAYEIGSNGLTFSIDGDVATGQGYTFQVTASGNGAVKGLILQSDLPYRMRSQNGAPVGLNIRLIKKDNIVLDSSNFTQEDTQVTIHKNITLTQPEFGSKDLNLVGGKMYFEYREWLQTMVDEINYCDSVSALDLIPGQLDPDNPLKYAVYKALANSNGVPVAFVAVGDEDDYDAWVSAFSAVEGAEDVYSVTPTTQDIRILNQAAAMIEAESGAEQCRWKTGVFSIGLDKECMLVGQNKVNNDLFETSTDGSYVTATFTDNLSESNNQYTLLTITSKDDNGIVNAKLSEYGVDSGDEVRVVTESGETVATYIVDTVRSNETLILMSGPSDAIDAGQRIEIWHKMSKTEQAIYYGQKAASFANRRVMVVAPDKVGESGMVLPGYFLAAAISGLKSGINAYQGMTRTEVVGFDDYSASKPYWNEAQLNKLAESGVCIVLEDANGTPYIRHALTTDMTSTEEQEEVITRDYDYICKQIHSILQSYIGQTSVTSEVIDSIDTAINELFLYFQQVGYITSFTDVIVQPHALLKDRIEVYATIALPFPVNNIEIYLTA